MKISKISIIIPAYNEEDTINKILNKVLKVKLLYEKEIIIVNDGSTDRTSEMLSKFEKIKNIRILHHARNLGKGAAVKTGLKKISGQIVFIQDADLEYDPEDYPALLKPFVERNASVVYGSRILKKENNRFGLFYIGGRAITLLANILYRTQITDEPTCYKVFSASVLKSIKINENGFEWEPEVTAKIAKMGIKIHEVPISYHPRREGKKITIKDGFLAVRALLKYRFVD